MNMYTQLLLNYFDNNRIHYIQPTLPIYSPSFPTYIYTTNYRLTVQPLITVNYLLYDAYYHVHNLEDYRSHWEG